MGMVWAELVRINPVMNKKTKLNTIFFMGRRFEEARSISN